MALIDMGYIPSKCNGPSGATMTSKFSFGVIEGAASFLTKMTLKITSDC